MYTKLRNILFYIFLFTTVFLIFARLGIVNNSSLVAERNINYDLSIGGINPNGYPLGNCTFISSNNLKLYGTKNKYPSGIPKIIHYVYRTSIIPSQYLPLVQRCMDLNKDAQFVFWTDFSAYLFMITNYQKYVYIYNKHFVKGAHPLKVSDVIRYFILLKYGGIYMDLDTKCQQPFGSVLTNHSCILSRDVEVQTQILFDLPYLAMNSFMTCIHGHHFFQYLVDRLNQSNESDIFYETGPMMLLNIFESYKRSMTYSERKDPLKSVKLADADTFSPYAEESLEELCIPEQVDIWRIKGCKDLAAHRRVEKFKIRKAVVVHLFLHLGYNNYKDELNISDHICWTPQNYNIILF